MTDESKPDGEESPEPELSEDEMAARLDEAIGRLDEAAEADPDQSDEVEVRIEDDEEEADGDEADDVAPAPSLGDVILSVAEGRPAPAEDVDTPDPAAEEAQDAEERWGAVDDDGESDLALQATDQPKTHDEIWGEVADTAKEDLVLLDVEERSGNPWSKLSGNEAPEEAPIDLGPRFEAPPPVARRATEAPRRAPPPSRSLPWRGITALREPELPDLLYIADAASERSTLLVAAWEWSEAEPAGHLLRLRLADDGPEVEWRAAAPHEPAIEARLVLEGESIRTRLALALAREQRGLRLGRDVLAGRFQVDPGTDAWPDEGAL